MGGQFSKRTESSNHSSRPPTRSNSNPKTTPDLTSYEDACRLDLELQPVGVDVRSLSLDSLQEVTSCLLDMNHEVVDVILECREDIWKDKELSDMVKEYFENSLVNLDFCNALEKFLKRARDSQLIVYVALQRFDEEQRELAGGGGMGGNGFNFFAKTLQELKDFSAAGDPFTDEFFAFFRSVQRHQMLMLTKLQRKKPKLDKKLRSLTLWRRVTNVMFGATFAVVLICSIVAAAVVAPPVATALAAAVLLGWMGKWFNSLWKKSVNEIKGLREIVSSMQIGTYIAIQHLDNIGVLVHRFIIVIEALLQNADFANDHEDGVVLEVGEIKKKVNEYMQAIEHLIEHANTFNHYISQARIVSLQRIIKYPSSH